MHETAPALEPYLVVDLDGTLVATDLLFEQLAGLLKTAPLLLFALPFWLLGGRAALKARLAERVPIDPRGLPYSPTVLARIEETRRRGGSVVLATASHGIPAERVAAHLGIFDRVFASTRQVNLKGRHKLAALREAYGQRSFAYIGDSAADLPLWREASVAIVVNPTRALAARVGRQGGTVEILTDKHRSFPSKLKALAQQLRMHQWSKNALVFLPMIAAHRFHEPALWSAAVRAFLAFCCMASAIYAFNDLSDLDSDRLHAGKRQRALASGRLPLSWAFALTPFLLVLTALCCFGLPPETGVVLLTYGALNVAYSARLKRAVMLDVVILAVFYNCRLWVGAAATGVPISAWMLAFSTFFFFGLALVKRYTELLKHGVDQAPVHGRGYSRLDAVPLLTLGITSSFLALLVLVLYFNSADVSKLYAHPERLWLLIPIMLYWSSRLWILAHRGQVDDDPVAFALKDRATWIVLSLMVGALGLAI